MGEELDRVEQVMRRVNNAMIAAGLIIIGASLGVSVDRAVSPLKTLNETFRPAEPEPGPDVPLAGMVFGAVAGYAVCARAIKSGQE